MMHVAMLIGAILAIPGRTDASSGFHFDIAMYSDAGCGSCNVSIPVAETKDIFIVAETDYPGGITGSELRVAGLPAGWTYVVTPSPASNVFIGDPMGPVGGALAFPTGTGSGNCILLYRVAITATTAANDVMLTIVAHNPPLHPNFNCPLLLPECDECFWRECVIGRPMWINSSQDCVVSTVPLSWSAIKSIYAD